MASSASEWRVDSCRMSSATMPSPKQDTCPRGARVSAGSATGDVDPAGAHAAERLHGPMCSFRTKCSARQTPLELLQLWLIGCIVAAVTIYKYYWSCSQACGHDCLRA